MACLRSPRVNTLPNGSAFWSAAKTVEELGAAEYFQGKGFNSFLNHSAGSIGTFMLCMESLQIARCRRICCYLFKHIADRAAPAFPNVAAP